MLGLWRQKAPTAPTQSGSTSSRPKFIPCRWCGTIPCRGRQCPGRKPQVGVSEKQFNTLANQVQVMGREMRNLLATQSQQGQKQAELERSQRELKTKVAALPDRRTVLEAMEQARTMAAQLRTFKSELDESKAQTQKIKDLVDQLCTRLGDPQNSDSFEGVARALRELETELQDGFAHMCSGMEELQQVFQRIAAAHRSTP